MNSELIQNKRLLLSTKGEKVEEFKMTEIFPLEMTAWHESWPSETMETVALKD